MSRMNDLDIRLQGLEDNQRETLSLLTGLIADQKRRDDTQAMSWTHLAKYAEATEHKMDQQLHLMQDMVRVEIALKALEEKIDKRVSNVMDRLIEMAMVRNGDAPSATVHRAQSRIDNTPADNSVWEETEEEWPPPGCDVMDSRG